MTAEKPTETLWDELTSPLNLALVLVIVYLVYKIVRSKFETDVVPTAPPPLPKIRKDLTVAELGKFDGTQPEGRVLLAVNGTIFDVTRGKRFYGPGGPYSAFAGKDATRGLATGQVAASDKEYDDCSDLAADEVSSAKEWEDQFREKYDIVGRLLKPGETRKTVAELGKFDGTQPEGRVLLAVNGTIFDVTRGKRFYGPGGPYSAFAGKDATRGLATGQVAASDKEYDDCSDLAADEVSSAKEWEDQFREKYDIVGRLLKPGETPSTYSDDESDTKKSQ